MAKNERETDLCRQDIAELAEELAAYQAIYEPYFKRKEQVKQAKGYLEGLMQTLPNKSIERIVLHNQGDDGNAIRAMQHFMSAGAWDDEAILSRHRQEVAQEIGSSEGVLIVDDSGFPKQGDASVGVKRQWCGQLGKVANCQVGVFVGYASQAGYTLLDRRLYLPEDWVTDEAYAERREKCGVPAAIDFQTKPELAAEMIQSIAAEGYLAFKWLTCDAAFGRDGDFLDRVGQLVTYFAEIPRDTEAWLERPKTAVPDWSGKGRKPTQPHLLTGQPAAQSVLQIAADLNPDQWSRQTIKQGSKGPLVADFAALRIINVRQGLPGDQVWLILRRNPLTHEIKFYLSNAPDETPLSDFVRISGLRWPIETGFENSKQELGMGDYQLRGWLGWHHHMTLVILAHFFLLKSQRHLQNNVPKLTLPQAILLLKAVLPQPKFDLNNTIQIVDYFQRRHDKAFLSHRKRRLALLNQLE